MPVAHSHGVSGFHHHLWLVRPGIAKHLPPTERPVDSSRSSPASAETAPSDTRTCRQALLAAERAISRLRRGLLTSLELAHLPHRRGGPHAAIVRDWTGIAPAPEPHRAARHGINGPPALGEPSTLREMPPLAAAVEQRLSLLRVTNLGTLLDIVA